MNINSIYSSVKLLYPTAQEFDVNVELQFALDEINGMGLQTKSTVTAVLPSGAEGDPLSRTPATAHNYYPIAGCLILPSNWVSIDEVFFGTTRLVATTIDKWLSGNMPTNSYFVTQTGEMYLSAALVADDVVTFYGRFGGVTIDILPDFWHNYLVYSILAGIYERVEKNADMTGLWTRRKNTAKTIALSKGKQVSSRLGTRTILGGGR